MEKIITGSQMIDKIAQTCRSGADIITSPAGAVAKYCDEHVCVSVCLCVCLSASKSSEPHARSLPYF